MFGYLFLFCLELWKAAEYLALGIYAPPVPVVMILRTGNVRMPHLLHNQTIIHIMVKQYRSISLADLMGRLFIYSQFLAILLLPSSYTVCGHPFPFLIHKNVFSK